MLGALTFVLLSTVALPDIIDAEKHDGGIRALAVGGWLYESVNGSLELAGSAGGPATAFTSCDDRWIVVGPKGSAAVLEPGGGRHPVATDVQGTLWDVAHHGCDNAVMVGEEGVVLEATLSSQPPRLARVTPVDEPGRTRRDALYAVAIGKDSAVAGGAGGALFFRKGGPGATWRAVPTRLDAAFLSIAFAPDSESFLIAGTGGIWSGGQSGVRPVHVRENEIFTRVEFINSRLVVATGQSVVAVSEDGGRSWMEVPEPGWLSVVGHRGVALLLGRAGLTKRLPSASPARGGPSQAPVNEARPRGTATRGIVSSGSVLPPLAPPWREADARVLADSCRSTVPHPMSPGFVDIQRAPAGLVIAGADGTVRVWRDGKAETVLRTGVAMLGVAVSASGTNVAVVCSGRFALSRDGGRSFVLAKAPQAASFYAAAYRGEELFTFSAEGQGYRQEGGRWTRLVLPRSGRIFSAAFASSSRGYAVGSCQTMLVTNDGGKTWSALRPPDKEPQDVLVQGRRLFVSGAEEGGVYASDDGGVSFRRLLPHRCMRFGSDGARVAVACGVLGNALWLSKNGAEFEPVKLDKMVHILLAAEFEPGGTLIAVGASDVVVQAHGASGNVVNDSPVVREGLRQALWLWNRLREEARAKPSAKVMIRTAP